MLQEGETDLDRLLRNLSPQLAGEWAFIVVSDATELDSIPTLMTFQESEGLTAIVPFEHAQGKDVRFVGTRIDLQVHSSLQAVGLTAAVSGALSERQIPANVVAAAYHDYIFVPTAMASIALEALNDLTSPVRIRRAKPCDLDRLAPLLDAYRVFYRQASDLAGARQCLEARFHLGDSVIFLAEVEGEAVGFAQLFPAFSSVAMRRVWNLNDLFVSPTARKLGVGTKLLRTSQEFARSDGAVRLLLTTAVDNFTAQGVYEAAGWKRNDQFYSYKFDLA